MLKRDMNIADYDPVLWQAIQNEDRRQEEHIELIASENYASRLRRPSMSLSGSAVITGNL